VRRIKAIDRGIYTIIGGNYANTSYDEALRPGGDLDFVGFSEGEPVMADLIGAINEGRPLETVEGIAYHDDREGKVVKTRCRELIADLEELPDCDRDSFDMNFYSREGNYFVYRFLDRADTRIASVMASRGCSNGCTFCTARLIWGGKIRYRDPVRVVDEMLRLRDRFGINTFCFFDANIIDDKAQFLRLAGEMIRRIPGIKWMSIEGMAVAALDREVISAICESGCKWYVLPFESGDQEILDRVGKAHRVEVVPEVIRQIREIEGTWISGNVITGFPFETVDAIEKTLRYATSLDLDWLYVYRFIPFPGIPMYKECVEQGFVRKYSWNQQRISELWTLTTPTFNAGWVAERNYEVNAHFNFFRNRNIAIRPDQAIRDFQYVLDRAPDNPLATHGIARSYRQTGDLDRAREWYRKTLALLADGEEHDLSNVDETSMDSISKSFVVIRKSIPYLRYFRQAGIDVARELRELGEPVPVPEWVR
jgi:radical SAM superfamily enzyme YgiQ (UPF0313 family)